MRAVEGDDDLALLDAWQGIRAIGFQSPWVSCCLEIAAPHWVCDPLQTKRRRASRSAPL